MCNISQGIWQNGIEEGKKLGIEEGKNNANLSALRNLMEKLSLSAAQAAEMLGITGKDREYCLQVLG